MIVFFWLVLLLGVLLVVWVLGIKARGSLFHWVRPYRTAPCQVVGKSFPKDTPSKELSSYLFEVNGFIRSAEQRSTVVMREWNHEDGTLFLGLVLLRPSEIKGTEEFQVRNLPAQATLRVSGSGKTGDLQPLESLKKYLERQKKTANLARPVRLSGQSFHLYQWQLHEDIPEPSFLARMMETTFQLRDIFIFPILLTIVAIGLIGTQQIILFPLGIGLIILLSGAVKFVFLHQIKDEAEEIHLQNY